MGSLSRSTTGFGFMTSSTDGSATLLAALGTSAAQQTVRYEAGEGPGFWSGASAVRTPAAACAETMRLLQCVDGAACACGLPCTCAATHLALSGTLWRHGTAVAVRHDKQLDVRSMQNAMTDMCAQGLSEQQDLRVLAAL
jgi:hypothetical protein